MEYVNMENVNMGNGYNFGGIFGRVCVFRGCWTEKFGDLDVLPILSVMVWRGTDTLCLLSSPSGDFLVFFFFPSQTRVPSVCLHALSHMRKQGSHWGLH